MGEPTWQRPSSQEPSYPFGGASKTHILAIIARFLLIRSRALDPPE